MYRCTTSTFTNIRSTSKNFTLTTVETLMAMWRYIQGAQSCSPSQFVDKSWMWRRRRSRLRRWRCDSRRWQLTFYGVAWHWNQQVLHGSWSETFQRGSKLNPPKVRKRLCTDCTLRPSSFGITNFILFYKNTNRDPHLKLAWNSVGSPHLALQLQKE